MSASAGNKDHFIGWYALPEHVERAHKVQSGVVPASRPAADVAALIPIYKRDGTFYSVCRGMEIPLIECANGLEWGLKPSSMVGTKITLDEVSKTYTITIVDSQLETFTDDSTSGRPRSATKVDAPTDWPDPTAPPPESKDDFLGWYQAAWFPYIRYEIRKNGDEYMATGQMFLGSTWRPQNDLVNLTPLADRPGFLMSESRGKTTSIIYNPAAKRFELEYCRPNTYSMRMPLVRIPVPMSLELSPASQPAKRIGIPSYKG